MNKQNPERMRSDLSTIGTPGGIRETWIERVTSDWYGARKLKSSEHTGRRRLLEPLMKNHGIRETNKGSAPSGARKNLKGKRLNNLGKDDGRLESKR